MGFFFILLVDLFGDVIELLLKQLQFEGGGFGVELDKAIKVQVFEFIQGLRVVKSVGGGQGGLRGGIGFWRGGGFLIVK